MKKAQMFILTVVFLIGMVFILQQIFLQYAFFDLPESAKKTPFYLQQSAKDGLYTLVDQASTCSELSRNLDEYQAVIEQIAVSSFAMHIQTTVNCSAFDERHTVFPAVFGNITVTEKDSETHTDLAIPKA